MPRYYPRPARPTGEFIIDPPNTFPVTFATLLLHLICSIHSSRPENIRNKALSYLHSVLRSRELEIRIYVEAFNVCFLLRPRFRFIIVKTLPSMVTPSGASSSKQK